MYWSRISFTGIVLWVRCWRILILTTLMGFGCTAVAGEDALYGAVAPDGSAFIRVFNATGSANLQARIAGKTLEESSPYSGGSFTFLPEGSHTLELGDTELVLTMRRDRFYTVIWRGEKAPAVLEGERFDSRRTALLSFFNAVEGGSLSLRTADGKTGVFDGVDSYEFDERSVNAVKVRLAVYDGSRKLADAKPIALERGKSFSLFAAGTREQPVLVWLVN